MGTHDIFVLFYFIPLFRSSFMDHGHGDSTNISLSWEARAKKLTGIPISEDMLYAIVSKNPPPMLNILASEDDTHEMFKENGRKLLKKLQENIPNFIVLNVTGHHDVHISNPGSFVKEIVEFLNKDFGKGKCRL